MNDKPELNVPLLRKTMEHIRAHPENWLQVIYRSPITPAHTDAYLVVNPMLECGTAMCFAGWACDLAGVTWRGEGSTVVVDEVGVSTSCLLSARALLGLTPDQSYDLFRADNTLADLERKVEALIDGTWTDV